MLCNEQLHVCNFSQTYSQPLERPKHLRMLGWAGFQYTRGRLTEGTQVRSEGGPGCGTEPSGTGHTSVLKTSLELELEGGQTTEDRPDLSLGTAGHGDEYTYSIPHPHATLVP